METEFNPNEVPSSRQIRLARIATARHNACGKIMPQAKAAKIVGVTIRTWQNWELDTYKMRLSHWKVFLQATKLVPETIQK